MVAVPEDAVTLAAASNLVGVVVLILDVSQVLGGPRRPALLEVRGELHDAEALLAIGANGPRVDLLARC